MSVRRAIAVADLATLNVSEFCRVHGISRDRFYAWRRRYLSEGDPGLEPRSRVPHRVANRTAAEVEDTIVALRKELVDLGVDAGPATLAFHLPGRLARGASVPSESTIWRVLSRRGLVAADPSKAPPRLPRSFAAARANECWQIDDTRWQLADGTEIKIINIIDDCTRVCIASVAVTRCSGATALTAMATGAAEWGWPERFLSDNAPALCQILAGALAQLGITAGHSRPYHPQTCGKVERFHQTLKLFLAAQSPARTLAELQTHLDRFRDYYNHQRPHRALGRAVPATTWATTPRSGPASQSITAPTTVAINTVHGGRISVGHRLKISLGATYNGDQTTTIITGTTAHVFIDGHCIRQITINPDRRNQPLHNRPGRPPHNCPT
jgi:transposase InsO family protein